jgi:TonB-linked SusC/RagA family outer membrane protein
MRKLAFLSILISLLFSFKGIEAKDISGQVLDEMAQPMPGVSIYLKGTSKGTITDIDGKYQLEVQDNDTLVFSFMGYKTINEAVVGKNSIEITMELESENLEEVVVIGYGTQKSKDLTAPITTIKSEDLKKQLTSNPVSALQGKVAGVHIINNGAPGSSPTIKIRGVGAMTNNESHTKPLYVVDGVFVDDISFIDNNDIETLTVFKDASSSAIYGVRAANGVVIITTKKGSATNVSVNYNGYKGYNFAVNKMKMTNAQQYVELVNEMRELDPTNYPVINPDQYKNTTNWYDEILRTAEMQSHSVSITGGSKKSSYNVGINYFSQDGILDTDNDYERFNVNFRSNFTVNERLRIGTSNVITKWSKQEANQEAFYQAYINPPVYSVYNDKATQAFPIKYNSPSNYPFAGSFANPVAMLNYFDNSSDGFKLVSNIFAELDIIKNVLKFKTSYGLNLDYGKRKNYTPRYSVDGTQNNSQSKLSKSSYENYKYVWDNTLTYVKNSREFGDISLMVGQSVREEKNHRLSGSAIKVPGADDQEKYITNGSPLDRDADDWGYLYRATSYFTRFSYSKDNKYLLSATFRADGSSKYTDKWGYFPSVGTGWVISREAFMKSVDVDNLKLRAGWGLMGNDNVESYSSQILGLTGVGASSVFGKDVLIEGVGAQTLVKKDLKWQSVGEFNIGVDYGFLDNNLSGSIDLYDRRTYDAIFFAPVASGGGTATLYGNNGTILNQGIEFLINYNKQVTADFSYNISFNASFIRNEVVEMNGENVIKSGNVRGNMVTRTQEGYPIGTFWGYEVDGIYQTKAETYKEPIATSAEVGFFKYKDKNGDGKIDQNDMTDLGSPIPHSILGLDLSTSYKNFDFSLSLYAQLGNKVYNAKRAYRDVASEGNFDKDFHDNRWHGKGTSNEYPSAYALIRGYNLQPNSFFVEDGSFLRIQNVRVAYNFEPSLLEKILVKKMSLYVSARQPYTLFGYNGFSPEVGGAALTSGIDTRTYPLQASYNIGINVTF